MGSLAGKSPSSTYKSLLKVADETNGVSTSTSQIQDGEGTNTCLKVSDDNLINFEKNNKCQVPWKARTPALNLCKNDGNIVKQGDLGDS